jgi:type IV secretory pathway VirB4 component
MIKTVCCNNIFISLLKSSELFIHRNVIIIFRSQEAEGTYSLQIWRLKGEGEGKVVAVLNYSSRHAEVL